MKKKSSPFIFIGLATVMLAFLGCSHDAGDSEPRYTVWTDAVTYTEFQQSFGRELSEGMFIYGQFSNEEFAQISQSLTTSGDDYKHSWTKSQIKDWFVGRGFDDVNANEWSAWLVSVDHGMIASRRGDIVDLIVK